MSPSPNNTTEHGRSKAPAAATPWQRTLTNHPFPRCYRMLVRMGSSPENAARILLDARRGDRIALLYLRTMSEMRRRADTDPYLAIATHEREVSWDLA